MSLLLLASFVVAGLQPEPQIVLIYRDLLRGGDAVQRIATAYDATCGRSTGPFTVLRANTPAGEAASIAKAIDAAHVPMLIERALMRVRQALPGAEVTICAYPGENVDGLPYLGGVGGLALGSGRIKLFLHPAPKGLGRVEYTVAHEYHHEVERVRGPQPRFGPLNTVVREGKADVFAVSLYPQFRPPHTQPLTDAELRVAWAQLTAFEKDPTGFGAGFMIGRFPDGTRWPGYRLGYEMVDAYVRARPQPVTSWISAPGSEIAEHFRHSERGRIATAR
jgi:uncharacterized protein YjaZ